jgi:hypothetical protein
LEFGEFKPKPQVQPNSAWMLSSNVTVPKFDKDEVRPQASAGAIPKVRNRVAKHGLADLSSIKSLDDFGKIEPAHLRQRPLPEQIAAIKQLISKFSSQHNILPISVIPVFEQSPLFKTYLKAGSMLIEKNSDGHSKIILDEIMSELEHMGMDSLSQQEFEAVADLKKDLETMAGL